MTGECLLCRIPGETDTIEHVFGSCSAMQPVRDWTALALAHVTGWAAPLGGELLHMVYGPDTDTPAGTVIRGVALDTVRLVRAARTSSEHRIEEAIRRSEVPERRMQPPAAKQLLTALRDRLSVAIIGDWQAATAAHAIGPGNSRRGPPRDVDEFTTRWSSVSEIVEGRCMPRPERLEADGP